MNPTIDEAMVSALLATAGDEDKAPAERYAALKHVCQLRGDAYQHLPLEQLRYVAAAMRYSEMLHRPALNLKDAAEAVASGFARRAAPSLH